MRAERGPAGVCTAEPCAPQLLPGLLAYLAQSRETPAAPALPPSQWKPKDPRSFVSPASWPFRIVPAFLLEAPPSAEQRGHATGRPGQVRDTSRKQAKINTLLQPVGLFSGPLACSWVPSWTSDIRACFPECLAELQPVLQVYESPEPLAPAAASLAAIDSQKADGPAALPGNKCTELC